MPDSEFRKRLVLKWLWWFTTSREIHSIPPYNEGMLIVKNSTKLLRKTKPRGRRPDKALSASFVRTAAPGRHADGNGLYLFVQPSGTRSWIQRLLVRGRRRELGLGSVALISLAEAREKAHANRKLAREGGDPLGEKRRTQGMPSFAEAAPRVVEQQQAGWRDPNYPKVWLSNLERYAFPRIGKMPVSEVTSADLLEILTPIWYVKAPRARCVPQRIRAVLEWAVAMEFRIDNPCDRIVPVLGSKHDVVEHMQALPHRDVPATIETVRASGTETVAKLAFEFLVLTAARWNEARGAVWTESDRTDRVWTVPATRMKAKREHRVPLCGPALETLDAARTLDDGASTFVFIIGDGKALFEKQLRRLLRKHKIAAVPHGFRSSFQNKVEAAYARSDLFERWRILMDDWARYLAQGPVKNSESSR